MNEQGQVAFSSLITSAAYGFNDEGVFRGDGQTLILIARRGQLTPDGQYRLSNFIGTAINDAGQVVFNALLADRNDENLFAGVGLFLADGIEMIEVMQPGRTLAGSTVNDVSWTPKHGVNALGQVAYLAGRTNNLDGAFLFTLEDIHWRTTGSGNWDNSPNWTVSTQPGYVHNVSIDPNMTVAVAGPAANVTVKSLVVGKVGGAGQPTLNLQAGVTLTATDAIDLKSNSVLDFQIGGTGSANIARLVTGGTAALDGMLKVSLLGPFLPAAGNSFDILDWNVAPSGEFTSAQLPMLAAGLMWNSSQLYTTGILSVTILGDYNGSGTVDAADYVLWRKTDGTQAGYDAWRTHFGETVSGGSVASANATVPEPATLVLLMYAAAGWCLRRGRLAC
jgi:hypothetical protein